MTYIEQLAKNFAIQLTKARRYNYSQQLLSSFFEFNNNSRPHFVKIKNKSKQNLDVLLVQNSQKAKTCIIYCHGLGSNKLQVLPIMKYFKDSQYNICSFDFSGSGKSEGKGTFYGIKEQEDINSVIQWLQRNKFYQNYVLWGRSMGAVASILSQQSCRFTDKIQCLILDSPFSSFQKISIQLAAKKSYIPQFLLGLLIQPLKKYFQGKCDLNPFKMNVVQGIKGISCKIMFIYSKSDSIVNYNHSMLLKLNCSKTCSEIQIKEDHNMQRSKNTHKQIYDFIEKEIKSNQDKISRKTKQKSRGISLTFKDSSTKSQKNQQNYKLNSSLMSCDKRKEINLFKPFCLATMKSFNRSALLRSSSEWQTQNSISEIHNFSMTLNSKRTNQCQYQRELQDRSDRQNKNYFGKKSSNKENWTCSINSICLQKRSGQNSFKKQEKQNRQNCIQNKINRPSIQLRRKNRFAF